MATLFRYVRLELLEGVVAHLEGRREDAIRLLQQSQAKWRKLQVSDTSLALLLNMGFSATEVMPLFQLDCSAAWF